MLINGSQLRSLVISEDLCRDPSSTEENSIKLTLDSSIAIPVPLSDPVSLKRPEAEPHFERLTVAPEGFIMRPGACVLACSREVISMPVGYFGFIQTAGTLARLFVSAHCNDGQVDGGYRGKITLELINHGPLSIQLHSGDVVARLFVLETSDKAAVPYSGRYQGASSPTTARGAHTPSPSHFKRLIRY
jgi:dCTP deaminase